MQQRAHSDAANDGMVFAWAATPMANVEGGGGRSTGKRDAVVLAAGADPKRWQLVQSALSGEAPVAFAPDLRGTLDLMSGRRPALLLLCSDLLDATADDCLDRVLRGDGPPILVITGPGTTVDESRHERADRVHFLEAATARTELTGAVRRSLPSSGEPQARRRRGNDAIPNDVPAYRPMVLGTSEAIRKAIDIARRVATVDVSVLLSGETGTGKELFARRIHCSSERARGPFRAVNLPSIPHELFESMLFGHERGSFTGAVNQATGAFEQACDGTLFLDEISSLELAAQPKLLRAIQEKEIERVGARGPVRCDVRIIAATNIDLKESIERREFRDDLYHRLSVITIEIPPLRRRREDIPLLVDFFAKKHAKAMRCPRPEISSAAMEALQRHEWPGNVRELENRLQRAMLLSTSDALRPEDFFDDCPARAASEIRFGECDYSLAEVEQAYIEEVLDRNGGNQSRAAQILGIDRKTLRTRRQAWAEQAKPTPAALRSV